MEIMIDFRGLTKYLTNDYVRQALFNELKERLHDKRRSCILEPGSRMIAENASGRLGILIAKDPATPASVLSRLASSQQQKVLEHVASNSNTHPISCPLFLRRTIFKCDKSWPTIRVLLTKYF